MSNQNSSLLKGRVSALLTKHKKEQVIKPALETATGCRVEVYQTMIPTYSEPLQGILTDPEHSLRQQD